MSNQPRIFVSYSTVDSEFTEQLVKDLRTGGAEVWVSDEKNPGGEFTKNISQGLTDCDWFLVVLSPDALASRGVELEVNAAIAMWQQRDLEGILPIIAKTVDPHTIPPLWQAFQRYDAASNYQGAVTNLLQATGATPIVEIEPATTQAPSVPEAPPTTLQAPPSVPTEQPAAAPMAPPTQPPPAYSGQPTNTPPSVHQAPLQTGPYAGPAKPSPSKTPAWVIVMVVALVLFVVCGGVVGVLAIGKAATPQANSTSPVSPPAASTSSVATQKVDLPGFSINIPATWTAFDLHAPDAKARIQAKVADGTITSATGTMTEGFTEKEIIKMITYAPDSAGGSNINVNVGYDKEEGDLNDQLASALERAAKNGDDVKIGEITKDNPHVHILKVIRKEQIAPYVIDQSIFKDGETVYVIVVTYPETDMASMSNVVSSIVDSLVVKAP